MFTKKLDDETIFHYDHNTDKAIIETVSDVAPILEQAKKERDAHQGGYKSENFNKVGTVDKVVFMAWCRNKGISSNEAWKNNDLLLEFLFDPDNSGFRTHPTFFSKRKT